MLKLLRLQDTWADFRTLTCDVFVKRQIDNRFLLFHYFSSEERKTLNLIYVLGMIKLKNYQMISRFEFYSTIDTAVTHYRHWFTHCLCCRLISFSNLNPSLNFNYAKFSNMNFAPMAIEKEICLKRVIHPTIFFVSLINLITSYRWASLFLDRYSNWRRSLQANFEKTKCDWIVFFYKRVAK